MTTFNDINLFLENNALFTEPCFVIHPRNAVDFRRVLGTYSPAPIGKMYGLKIVTSKWLEASPLTYRRNERKITWGGMPIYRRTQFRKSEGRALLEKWRYNIYLDVESEEEYGES